MDLGVEVKNIGACVAVHLDFIHHTLQNRPKGWRECQRVSHKEYHIQLRQYWVNLSGYCSSSRVPVVVCARYIPHDTVYNNRDPAGKKNTEKWEY